MSQPREDSIAGAAGAHRSLPSANGGAGSVARDGHDHDHDRDDHDHDHDEHFLQGGGEMGARMRAHDWSRTPLGAPAGWPQSLRTVVRVMLDSRYAMWMLWGPDKTFFCNDAYLPTVGIKRGWVLGARADKVWEEIWPDIGPRIDHVLRHGEATWDEALLLFLERSRIREETYHTFSYSPVYDDANRIAGMLCVVTEVTERVIDERRLRALRDLAADAGGAKVDSAECSCARACAVLARYPYDLPYAALYLTDAGARIARRVAVTGDAAARALPAQLSLDRPPAHWPLVELYRSESACTLTDTAAAGLDLPAATWPDPVRQVLLLPLKGSALGLAGFMVAACSPRRALDDAYRSFLALVAGQTSAAIADAQAYEAERRRAQALAELDRAKTTFFSNVSHEFRTPLTLMLGPLLDATRDPQTPPALRERLELALRNAGRLQRLVNALLDFSRIEAGRAMTHFEPTDLAALTRDLASSFRSAMERAGLSFDIDCAPLPAPVLVDRQMWEKIVLNLLSNAFKFTLAGSVGVRLRAAGELAVLEVSDTGAGIAREELPRLFERFHRIEGTAARTHEGTGIGLALVQELVKLHGGAISADSVPGQGSTFRVSVPVAQPKASAPIAKSAHHEPAGLSAHTFVEEALGWLPESAEGAPSAIAPPAQLENLAAGDRRFAATFGSRIVVADDNADMRAYLRALLSPYYSVQTVADGTQALAAARAQRPDLILSDVMMPNLGGFGLLAAVRGDELLRSTPVVLLSARAGEESRIEGLDAGADDYIVKPFSARELHARLGALLELRHMRRVSEEAFRLRTAQFETLLNYAPMGVYVVDADFRVRDANPTARQVFDDDPRLEGADFDSLVHRVWPAAHADRLVQLFRRTLQTGEPWREPEHIEQRLDRGVVEYYEWQINRMPQPDGRNGVVCYFRDISAHVRTRERMKAADRQKDEFLAMLAHELRNPLAPIRNAGEVLALAGVADGTPAANAVQIIRRQVANLTRLVDDLLDVSRITQGRVDLQLRPVMLAEVVAHAAETVSPLIRERGHRFSVSTRDDLRLLADPPRLVQCLANVLNNAAKYTDAGGTIRLEALADGPMALLRVTDTGIGIPAELQARVFDLFVQGDRTLDRSQGGLGIGLSVVKRLVEMHQGSVSLHSDGAGRGSRFEIRLPLLERHEPVAQHEPRLELRPRRVLVVDDNVDAADSLALMLSMDGHQVQSAYTPQQALERAAGGLPEVAILDIGLPGMDGFQLAARIRALPGLERIGLIALTGYGQQRDSAQVRRSGFDAYLVKPSDYPQLQRALARVTSRTGAN